jgi:hypothetical protein
MSQLRIWIYDVSKLIVPDVYRAYLFHNNIRGTTVPFAFFTELLNEKVRSAMLALQRSPAKIRAPSSRSPPSDTPPKCLSTYVLINNVIT